MKINVKHYHLSPAQLTAVLDLIHEYKVRPSFWEYDKEHKALAKLPTAPKPKASKIPNTTPGYEPSEVKLLPAFDAINDLPEGWAVYSQYDSGSNFGIINAAEHLWRTIWNSWAEGKPFDASKLAAISAEWEENASPQEMGWVGHDGRP